MSTAPPCTPHTIRGGQGHHAMIANNPWRRWGSARSLLLSPPLSSVFLSSPLLRPATTLGSKSAQLSGARGGQGTARRGGVTSSHGSQLQSLSIIPTAAEAAAEARCGCVTSPTCAARLTHFGGGLTCRAPPRQVIGATMLGGSL